MSTTSPPAVSWFEVPVEDVDRAVAFYEAVLDAEFTVDETTGDAYPMFMGPDGGVQGALTLAGEYPVGEEETPISYAPGGSGMLVYLTIEGGLDSSLDAVESAGGEVRAGPAATPDGATYAVITDTEGNRVGLMAGR